MGDLQGVAQRLDYLQSLGIDALVLRGPLDAEALGDLVREASQRHLRVVVALRPAIAAGPRDALLATVHDWLSAGVAGVMMPAAGSGLPASASYASLVGSLRQILQSFPGERILLTDPVPLLTADPGRAGQRRGRGLAGAPPRGGQLTTTAALPVERTSAAQLRTALAGATNGTGPEENAVLQFATDPATGSPNAAAYAAALFASRGAAVFDFGEEIGMDLFPSAPSGQPETADALPLMQWTPSNHTPPPTEHAEEEKSATPAAPEFGAYHPYQPPPRGLTAAMPAPARVTADANIPAALPDADSLPGFTSGTLMTTPVDGTHFNVVTEDRDPKSLLNAYRALIGLHHDNATLRNGTQYVINCDADNALVWLRRAPAGSRTVANIVVAANLSDKGVVLSLDSDVEALGMRPGALRPLFTYAGTSLTGETTAHLSLPPHAVFLGEIYHAGPTLEAARPEHRGRRSRRR